MELKGKTIGFAVTGSHCTYAEAFPSRVITLGIPGKFQ